MINVDEICIKTFSIEYAELQPCFVNNSMQRAPAVRTCPPVNRNPFLEFVRNSIDESYKVKAAVPFMAGYVT